MICVSCCRIKYPKVKRKKFSIKDSIYNPALPFMFNMTFLMIPYGAVIAYSSILAQEKNLMSFLPYFYICLVIGMLLSKISTQKMIDAGKHRVLVYISLVILVITMTSYIFLTTGAHLLIAGFFFGIGYGILQPLFQSFVTGTTPAPKRGVANATYLLSYDIGIGIGSLLMGCLQESIGLQKGFALTAIAYVVGGIIYIVYSDRYYRKLKTASAEAPAKEAHTLAPYMKKEVYALQEDATVYDAIAFFSEKNISGAPILSKEGTAIGFISDGDIMRYMKEGKLAPMATDSSTLFMEYLWDPDAEFHEKINTIMHLNILEIGTKKAITIDADASIQDVCKLLGESGVKKVPVVSENKVVGILLRSAIIKYLEKQYLEQAKSVHQAG